MYGTPLENPRWEAFCLYFVLGNPKRDPNAPKDDPQNPPDTRNNATRSYIQAGYTARGNSASVCAHKLLRNAQVQARLVELRDEATRIKKAFMRQWAEMLPDAQDVLARSMAGEDVSANEIRSAKHVIDQAEGPTRFRFGVQKGADKDASGWNVTLWSGRKEDDSVSDALGEG